MLRIKKSELARISNGSKVGASVAVRKLNPQRERKKIYISRN